jgi:hypothetical protein
LARTGRRGRGLRQGSVQVASRRPPAHDEKGPGRPTGSSTRETSA